MPSMDCFHFWCKDLHDGGRVAVPRTNVRLAAKGRDGDGVLVENREVVREPAVETSHAAEFRRQVAGEQRYERAAQQGLCT